MNLRTFTTKTVAAGLALAIGIPAIAMAAHPFEDVPDGQWFSDAVDWAYENDLTTGKTATTFNGWDTMNRYEGVVFFERYHTNMVAPIQEDLDATDASLSNLWASHNEQRSEQFAMFGFDNDDSTTSHNQGTVKEVPVSTTVTIPEGYKGRIDVGLSAESVCYNSTGYCRVHLYVDADEIGFGDNHAFDSTDANTEGASSWESHAINAVSDELDAGTYTITVGMSVAAGTPIFHLDDITLTAQVHLTDTADLGFGS